VCFRVEDEDRVLMCVEENGRATCAYEMCQM
jgi:hypothetical protein